MGETSTDFARIWSGKLARLKGMLRKLPRDVGNEALKFFVDGFKKEESPDGKPWKQRKVDGAGVRSSRRALLVQTGRLRKSIRLTRITSNSVTIGSDVFYGKYHNQGTSKLPQRQFIGSSSILSRRLQRMLKAKILWALRK